MRDRHAPWDHHHCFHRHDPAAERGTRSVLWITLAAMAVEIAAGWWSGSMALMADGWHMSSHAAAIGMSVLAYAASRRLANDRRFTFGTWKIEVLGGFSSGLFLLGIAALMAVTCVQRLVAPQPIQFREALLVAVIGLLVNLVCAWILRHAHHHGHGHDHGHASAHGHAYGQDLNLRSAYLHVMADALTSVLAILALVGGWIGGWIWLDPVMGVIGAVLVAAWARSLIIDTSRALLDREMDHPVVDEIREVIGQLQPAGETELTDLHVWRVGREAYACVLALVTSDATLTAQRVREALAVHEEIAHSTIEIHRR